MSCSLIVSVENPLNFGFPLGLTSVTMGSCMNPLELQLF